MSMAAVMPMAAIMPVSMAMQKAEELVVHVVCGGGSRSKRGAPNQA
jgi:hypothetical protein